MHRAAYCHVQQELKRLPTPRSIADLGGRNVNGHIRDLLPKDVAYTSVDLIAGRNVDVVADAAEWGEAGAYDLVLSLEVFEHAENAAAICANAYRILSDDGVFIATMAGQGRKPHSAIDGGPLRPGEYYQNRCPEDLVLWLADFDIIEMEINEEAADLYVTAWK